MARKRRIINKDIEEEYEFIPPEFDEEEFIRKDIYGTKVLLIVAAMAVVIGIICSYIQKMFSGPTGVCSGFVLLFSSIIIIRPLLKLIGLDINLLEKKSVIGNDIMFLLLGLGVWILFVNPPFY
ncbi:MAG: hypothetical protein MJZ03_03225 [archaeon]|nr:hypothetical protein [archaeon]